MAPWNLAFVAPEAQFIWGVEGGNINMDTGTSLFTLTKTVSLGSPDLFDLIIFADDHCDVFVNGGFMGSAIYPPILFPDDASAAVTIHLGAQHSGDLNLALRCSNSLYRGCAGVVAALKDSSGATRAVTDGSWRVSTAGQQQISVSADSINSSECIRQMWVAMGPKGGRVHGGCGEAVAAAGAPATAVASSLGPPCPSC